MPRSFEILARVSMSGCDELVHHLETVEGFTPSSSDNHLLVFFVPLTLVLGDLRLA